ncbi:GGDEF domain-containing protein [Fibrobacter sp.]|uniref:GGDEF domain-containing protein n=1 Tax=Fibrobacter sp. TaxID=35828 RepID=UPI002635DBA6|nr:GGDEF domain-containing protein [Fibrobacter sp.]MDD5941092.1 GGDEF domain-containing protein [Fibrobacter sp.]
MVYSTFFLAAEIANHQLVNQLEILSSVDMLTGVKNRNAMNNLVSRIVTGKLPAPKRFGVVFADVNGLKPVNDNEGHEAGDNLLKRAARVLKEAFEGYDVFRAGGDEFVVVAQDIGRDDYAFPLLRSSPGMSDSSRVAWAFNFFRNSCVAGALSSWIRWLAIFRNFSTFAMSSRVLSSQYAETMRSKM